MLLRHKVAIVTGGDSGIGRSIAVGLAQAGAAVTVNYHSDRPAAEEVERDIVAAGGRALIVQGDVSKVADIQHIIDQTVTTFGRLDVMVNNAGMETRTSVHEDWPMPGNIPYCCAKGGVRMLTRTAGVELGPRGITVVGVGPGAVDTPINKLTLANPAEKAALDKAIPLGRVAEPSEIAGLVIWLASDEARYVTATTYFVDGGIMQSSVGL